MAETTDLHFHQSMRGPAIIDLTAEADALLSFRSERESATEPPSSLAAERSAIGCPLRTRRPQVRRDLLRGLAQSLARFGGVAGIRARVWWALWIRIILSLRQPLALFASTAGKLAQSGWARGIRVASSVRQRIVAQGNRVAPGTRRVPAGTWRSRPWMRDLSLFASGAAASALVAAFAPADSPVEARTDSAHVAPAPAHPSPARRTLTPDVSSAIATADSFDDVTRNSAPEPSRDATGPSRPLRGSLVVTSQPAGASVFINNEYAGVTPLSIREMPAGSRAVRVRLDGYAPWSRAVRIVAHQSARVAAQLQSAPPR